MIMGALVYFLHFLSLNPLLTLGLQVAVGAAFYLAVSIAIQFEPFVYLVQMLQEKFRSARMNRILSKCIRSKR